MVHLIVLRMVQIKTLQTVHLLRYRQKNKMVVIVDDFAGKVAIEKFNNEMKTRSLDGTEVFVL